METLSQELKKIASQSKDFDKDLADELDKLGSELEMVEKSREPVDAADVSMFEVQKQAKLINPGEKVVCVNPISPLFKGRVYLCSDNSMPGFIAVKELDGSDVGIFEVNRFVLDQKEY